MYVIHHVHILIAWTGIANHIEEHGYTSWFRDLQKILSEKASNNPATVLEPGMPSTSTADDDNPASVADTPAETTVQRDKNPGNELDQRR